MKQKNFIFKKGLAFLFFINIFVFNTSCVKKSESVVRSKPKENAFRIAIEAKIPTLDPAKGSDVYSSQVESLFYEPLYQYHYLKKNFEIVPLLADGMPTIKDNGKTYIIKIKKGIKFHNDSCFKDGKGREVTAHDVVYSLTRLCSKEINSPFFGAFSGKVVGADEYFQGKANSVEGFKAIDDYTIMIKTTKKYPRFLHSFTDIKTSVLAKECVEKYKDELSYHPVGTGPFIPKEINLNSKIVAVKNENYNTSTYPTDADPEYKAEGLLQDAGKKLPLVDKVELEVLTERQPAWLKFKAGQFEMSDIPKDNMATALPNGKLSEELEKQGIKLYKKIKGDVTVQIFNMKDPLWGKYKELRQAVALALDVPKIIEIQYSNQATRAHSIIDPTQYGYDEKFVSKWANRDLKKAKELIDKVLKEANLKELPPLEMVTVSSTTSRQFDELLTKQLKEAGITLKTEAMTWPEMMKRVHTHNFMLVNMAYVSSTPDAEDAVGIVDSKSIETGYNVSSYSNPEIDKLIREIEELENGPKRLEKIKRFKEILDEDLPIISLTHRIGNQLIQPWVKNHVYLDSTQIGNGIKYHKIVVE